jgi:hypothetical protein
VVRYLTVEKGRAMREQRDATSRERQLSTYDLEFRTAIESMPENAIVMIQDDYRSLLKWFARNHQPEWAAMCEVRVDALLDELTRQYEVEEASHYGRDSV